MSSRFTSELDGHRRHLQRHPAVAPGGALRVEREFSLGESVQPGRVAGAAVSDG